MTPLLFLDDVSEFSLEETLEMIPNGLFQYRLFAICGLAFMTDSLGVNLLSFLTTCAAAEWNLTNAGQAVLTSIVFVGMIAGSLFWGRFADDFGRKKTLLYACLMVTIGGFASSIAPSYVFLVICRAIAGFGIGGASVPFDLLAELLPVTTRSKYLVYMGIFWTLGSMLVAGMAWAVLPILGWRFLAFVTTIPVLLTTMLAYVYLPESPRWLMEVGREAEAIQVLREAALVNKVVLPVFRLSSTHPRHSHTQDVHGSYKELIATPEARRVTLPLWVIWGLFGFTYYGIILFVSRVYSNQDDVSHSGAPRCNFQYTAIFYNATSEIFSVFISAALIETLGRVKSQSVFYAIGGIGVMCMGLTTSPAAVLLFSLIARMGINSGLVSALSAFFYLPSFLSVLSLLCLHLFFLCYTCFK